MSTSITKSEGGQPGNRNAVKWTKYRATRLGLDLLTWMHEQDENMFIADYLAQNGYYQHLVPYLSRKYKVFESIMAEVKALQEVKICRGALTNKLNPAVSIFLLKNNHGYTDRQDLRHSVNVPPITYVPADPPPNQLEE